MGCISSKTARPESHVLHSTSSANGGRSKRRSRTSSSLLHARGGIGLLEKIKEEPEKEEGMEEEEEEEEDDQGHGFVNYSGNLKALKEASQKKSAFSFKFGRLTEGEHVVAGWPAWLSAVAGEAIEGWLPLRSETYERLEKIGQGTYSNVYRARDLKTGRIVAVKKVRFDSFQPESVRFMAREILILRKLDHPNVMKLEGIITSRLSSHIYLVFEYMEHDLAGLLSCPDIKFRDSQIKCYMMQLLSGIEHCHSRGILHRDIKTSNILVNNDGILKIADFGLANCMRPKNRQSLTSRVVTLWYRPPELLLGSTDYGEAVDLWSIGCVFAELFLGRPLFKGRTEVEQLHKIFKLCGSPRDDYLKRSRLPLANMFGPHQQYESTLRERCREFPKSAVSLMETFLSVEPYKRGTASSALNSKYFNTKPYACDPTSLPKYPPNKEMDAKIRESRRKKAAAAHGHGGSRVPRRSLRTLQESSDFFKVVATEDFDGHQFPRRGSANSYRRRNGHGTVTKFEQSYDTLSEASRMTEESQVSHGTSVHSVPVLPSAPNGITFARRPNSQNVSARHKHRDRDQLEALDENDVIFSYIRPNDDSSGRVRGEEVAKRILRWEQEQEQLHHPDSFGPSDTYDPQELYVDTGTKKKKGRVTFSAPMVYPSQEQGLKQHDQSRQVHQRSRFCTDS